MILHRIRHRFQETAAERVHVGLGPSKVQGLDGFVPICFRAVSLRVSAFYVERASSSGCLSFAGYGISSYPAFSSRLFSGAWLDSNTGCFLEKAPLKMRTTHRG